MPSDVSLADIFVSGLTKNIQNYLESCRCHKGNYSTSAGLDKRGLHYQLFSRFIQYYTLIILYNTVEEKPGQSNQNKNDTIF